MHLIKKKAGQGTKAAGASAGSAAAVGEAEGAGAAGSAAEGSTKQASGEKQQAAETKYAHAHAGVAVVEFSADVAQDAIRRCALAHAWHTHGTQPQPHLCACGWAGCHTEWPMHMSTGSSVSTGCGFWGGRWRSRECFFTCLVSPALFHLPCFTCLVSPACTTTARDLPLCA
eukprot:COSAG01_NODE_7688_length_3098_cov_71.936646_6_plen_172_part_00